MRNPFSKPFYHFEPPAKYDGNKFSIKNWRRLSRRDIAKAILVLIGAFVFGMALLFAWYARDLPTPKKLAARRATESTKIFDRDGKLLYETGQQRRTVIDKKDIPDYMKKATIAVEDKDFYRHHGIKFTSILRAALSNITHRRITQGGSTITQQFIKNALLSPQRTFTRKIKELILAIELESIYSKDDILAMYLNEIPYGSNYYGIQAASQGYFGKDAKDLTLSEAALLAALPQRPTYYSPYGSHTEDLFKRKNYVLDEMAEQSYLTGEQAETAKKEAPNKDAADFQPRKDNILAPHFVIYIRELLVDKFGERIVDEGGLRVTTTLNYDLQEKAEEAILEQAGNFESRGASNAALVAIDPKTGQVLAMVGSKDYFNTDIDGNVNVALASRQPGSSLKPIVYATAFKGKYNPAHVLFDLTTDFGGYTPHNYDGSTHGPVTMRQALSNSLNIPAVKTLGLVGVEAACKTAAEMGYTTLTEPDRYGLALVLGGGEVKLLEHTGAFGIFANKGVYAKTTPFLKIEDRNGNVLEEYAEGKNQYQALDPNIAYEITSILSDQDSRQMIFGGIPAMFFDLPVALKTGTTQEFRDAWTVGYTPNIAIGVWVGNNDNTPMRQGADGSIVAAPIFKSFLYKARGDQENPDFERPESIKEIAVDKFSNKLPTQYSPDTITDIFAPWQVPSEKDDIHVVVRVNRVNGKLATDTTPESLIEERLYTNIHSEMPDNPNWEGPVRSWAAGQGWGATPPKEYDDMYDAGGLPGVKISSPQNDATITGNSFQVKSNPDGSYQISEVNYEIDGSGIGTARASPWAITVNTSQLSGGEHTLTATATDQNGATATDSIKFSYSSPKANISGVSATGITANSATITFSTNISADSEVVYGASPGNRPNHAAGGSGTYHSITLSGLSSHATYYFVAQAETAGGATTSSEYSFTTK